MPNMRESGIFDNFEIWAQNGRVEISSFTPQNSIFLQKSPFLLYKAFEKYFLLKILKFPEVNANEEC